jgi:ATP-binding cassette, subfamily B (MDR/TAP), member 1
MGEILIDGINIKDYDIHHLRASMGVVSQEPVLFNDSIKENIIYNRFHTTREEMIAAANESNFNPEVEKIEGDATVQKRSDEERHDGTGFDKNVGVKGSHISGGQKQRVAIARVILRQPGLLLLDEATSALDSSNEKKVQDSLDRIMRNKTSITIAHRIDTIRNADQIMVFHLGKLVESGTYEQLMDRKAYFYNLEQGLEIL